jgi:hypothetical protein
MKWLLITTATRTAEALGTNVGDEFALLGTQRVIRAVDPDAEFIYLNKEDSDAWEPVAFDKAVVCGMPLFWSLPGNECKQMWWWPRLLRGWPSAVRENFLVFGVGHVYTDRIHSLLEYTAAIQEVLHRSYALTVREPIIDHPQVIDTVCPSAFSLFNSDRPRHRKLCNLMADGGHFGYLNEDVTAEWNKGTAPLLAAVLQAQRFEFVAHTQAEHELAIELGWKPDQIHLLPSAQAYLDLYAEASCYLGNRMHGAAVVASTGAPVWAFTHDSRVGMVRRLGGHATDVSAVTTDALMEWLVRLPDSGRTVTPYRIGDEFRRMVHLMRRFMEAGAKAPWSW